MLLYHGTSERLAKFILKNGLRPRGTTGKSQWKDTVESNPKAVYLTDAYPLHFSIAASNNKERLAVIEVETDRLHQDWFHPDEDVLEQAGRKFDSLPKHWTMKQRTRYYRTHAVKNPNWELSLKMMGTCAYYGTIPPLGITRVIYYDRDKAKSNSFEMAVGDTSVSILNYKIMQHVHRARLDYLLGKTVSPADFDVMGIALEDIEKMPDSTLREMYMCRWKDTEAMLADREAIEIVPVCS